MKLFEVPMVVTSLLGLCVFTGLDAPVARANFTFGTPTNLGPKVNTSEHDDAPTMPADGLSLFFSSTRLGGIPVYDLFVITRETLDGEWSAPVNLGSPVNMGGIDVTPNTSADGLMLLFASDRPGGSGILDLWLTTRQTKEGPWAVPVNLGPVVNSLDYEWTPSLSADTLELYFSSNRVGGHGSLDLWVTRRATPQSAWGPPVNLGPTINTPDEEYCPALSADGLCLMFSSTRPGGYGSRDVWITTRASRDDPWRTPWNPGPPLNSSAMDAPNCISPDGSTLYFSSSRSGGYGLFDLCQASIIRIVDFNGDGKVDGKEVLAMAQHWGQDKSLYDIGPTPFGDGVVDTNDLTVLAEYIGPKQDVNDPTLIAHWALDETEGVVAVDSAGGNNVMVLGNPAWQPAGGKIGGALAFDGKDDFGRSTSFVLDPSKGPFSVIAWVKGGATSRVIVSQASGADWLYLHQYGALTTDLMSSDRKTGKLLASSAFLIDDQWHRVVFTWDGTNRILGVDGVEVARDTQPSLAASSGHLHIGAGKYVAPATYWTGLIDDVRIYNRAVKP